MSDGCIHQGWVEHALARVPQCSIYASWAAETAACAGLLWWSDLRMHKTPWRLLDGWVGRLWDVKGLVLVLSVPALALRKWHFFTFGVCTETKPNIDDTVRYWAIFISLAFPERPAIIEESLNLIKLLLHLCRNALYSCKPWAARGLKTSCILYKKTHILTEPSTWPAVLRPDSRTADRGTLDNPTLDKPRYKKNIKVSQDYNSEKLYYIAG